MAVVAAVVAVAAICVATAGAAVPALVATGASVAASSTAVAATASTVAVAAANTAAVCAGAAVATETIERKLSRSYTVYYLADESGTTRYVGRVSDVGYQSRMNYHRITKGLVPAYKVSGLSYATARGLEEIGMVECHTLNPGRFGNNQIHGISANNSNGAYYMSSAISYLENKAEQTLLNLLQ